MTSRAEEIQTYYQLKEQIEKLEAECSATYEQAVISSGSQKDELEKKFFDLMNECLLTKNRCKRLWFRINS